MPDDDPPGLVALTRLQVLNTVLLADALDGRSAVSRHPYETAVLAPGRCSRAWHGWYPSPSYARGSPAAVSGRGDTSAPTAARKSWSRTCARRKPLRRKRPTATLAAGRCVPGRPGTGAELARRQPRITWLAPDPAPRPPAPPRGGRQRTALPGQVDTRATRYLRWRNLLVTNAEFAAILNEMAGAGTGELPGRHLPAGLPDAARARRAAALRPGCRTVDGSARATGSTRLLGDLDRRRRIRRPAGRPAALPGRDDRRDRPRDLTVPNGGYQAGDTIPVTRPGPGSGRDPPPGRQPAGLVLRRASSGTCRGRRPAGCTERHGTPRTRLRRSTARWRHLTGASRGVGIRLVRDGQRPAATEELAGSLRGWVETSLTGTGRCRDR